MTRARAASPGGKAAPVTDEAESPLRRWARRKAQARHEGGPAGGRAPADDLEFEEPAAASDGAPVAIVATAETAPETGPEPDPEPPADLPSIAGLNRNSDYTPFLREGVPEALTRAALRKLWLSDPVFANLDGLNDYDEDFTIIRAIAADALSPGVAKAKPALAKAEPAAGDGAVRAEAAETLDHAQPDAAGPDSAKPDSAGSGTAEPDGGHDDDSDEQPEGEQSA